MRRMLAKNKFLVGVIIMMLVTALIKPSISLSALQFSWKTLLNSLFMLLPIFICIGLMDVWVDRETMMKTMGKEAGIKGILLAMMLGVVTAVPLYALLPVAGVLLKKGCRISNVLLFVCSSANSSILTQYGLYRFCPLSLYSLD